MTVILVYIMFDLYPKFKPGMARAFGQAGKIILDGLKQYAQEVTGKSFPVRDNHFTMNDEKHEKLLKLLE